MRVLKFACASIAVVVVAATTAVYFLDSETKSAMSPQSTASCPQCGVLADQIASLQRQVGELQSQRRALTSEPARPKDAPSMQAVATSADQLDLQAQRNAEQDRYRAYVAEVA